MTGTIWLASTARRSPCWSWSAEISWPSRYISISRSSFSATASINWSWAACASSVSSAGMSPTSNLAPSSSPDQIWAWSLTRSITPWKFASLPIGNWMGQAFAASRSRIWATAAWKSAPVRSILFTNARRGTEYLLAWRQTVSDCGSTPPTAQNTATAPSSTRRLRSTSTVKSTWPGVSMILIRWSRQKQVVAALVMVIPRSCSCSIQSMVAVPSWTSPIL